MTVPGLPAKMIGSKQGPMPLRGDVGLQGKAEAKGGDAPFSRLLQEKQGALNRAEKGGKRAAGAEKTPRGALTEGKGKVAGFEKAAPTFSPEGETAESTPAEGLAGASECAAMPAAIPAAGQRLQPGVVPSALSARPSKDGGEGSQGVACGEGTERTECSPAAAGQSHKTVQPAVVVAEAGEGLQAAASGGVKPAGETVPESGAIPLGQELNVPAAAGFTPERGGTSGGPQGQAAPAGAVPGPAAVAEGRTAAMERTAPRENRATSGPVTAAAPTGGTAAGDTAGLEMTPAAVRPGSEGGSGRSAELVRGESDGHLDPATESPLVDPPRPEGERTARVGKLSDPAAGRDDRPAIPSAGPSALGVASERGGGKGVPAANGGQGELASPIAMAQKEEPRGGLLPLSGSGSQPASAEGTLGREGRPFETIPARGQGYEQPALDGQVVRTGRRPAGSEPEVVSGRPEFTPAALGAKDMADPAAATAKRGAAMAQRDGDAVQGASPRDEGLFPQRPFAVAKVDVLTESPSAVPPAPERDGDGGAAASSRGAADQDSVGGSLRAAGETAPAAAKAVPVPPVTGARAQAIMEQIVAARQQISPEGGRIRVTLSPAELGDVDLEIVVRRHRVEVVMIAERPEIQQLLQSRGDEIRSALLRQDMKVETFQVLLQDHGEGSGQQSAAWMGMDGQRRGREKESAPAELQRGMRSVQESRGLRAHRGSVSIFA